MRKRQGLQFLAFTLFFFGCSAVPSLSAEAAYTAPAGRMKISILGGTPAAPVTTRFALQLHDIPGAEGKMQGVVTGVGSNTLSVEEAAWIDGALADSSAPYDIQIMSGNGEGARLAVTANTSDTLTVAGRDLASLDIAPGDRFRLIPVDTLDSLFGPDTLLGGSSAAVADVVTLSSSLEQNYYYNTSLSRWVRTSGPPIARGRTRLPSEGMISITRRGNAMDLYVAGSVPIARLNMLVSNSGSTYTHTGFPTATTLAELALQDRLSGWLSSPSATNADILAVASGGIWNYYFHNGSNWRRTSGPPINRDGIVISAGTPVQIFRRGTGTGSAILIRDRPFLIPDESNP